MEYHGLKINLAELAMVLTALGAMVTAWKGGKAAHKAKDAKPSPKPEEERNGTENRPGN